MTTPTGAGPTTARVALLLVSHSSALADGAADLAAQMAPNVLLVAAGGLEDGSLGTSFDLIGAGLDDAAQDGRSVVVLTDLGSAVLTTESVLEFAGDEVSARVRLADAPFVEGAVAAAVAAAGGGRASLRCLRRPSSRVPRSAQRQVPPRPHRCSPRPTRRARVGP